jgi:hypothetical protein
MRIFTPDGTLEIVRGSFDSPWDLDAVVESQGFSGHVSNIFPTNVAAFFSRIRAIERNGEGTAVLLGTEDFEFTLRLFKGNGAFLAEIAMASGFGEGPPCRVLRCRLRVDGEYWSSTVTGLRQELVGS